jgi:galactonate dehydratase
MASVPNFFRQELMLRDVPWRDQCLSHPLPIADGFFTTPDRPGLGFDVDPSVLEDHPGIRKAAEGKSFYI